MTSKKQVKNKTYGVKRFVNSFKNSFAGLAYAYRYEQSLWLHAAGTIGAIILGFLCQITFKEWAVVVIALVVVLTSELLNTAIEATVDLVTEEIHPLAKIAKDCASAATFVSTVMAIIICLFIYIPYIVEFFK